MLGNLLLFLIGFPICLVLFVLVAGFATLLWPICLVWALIDYIIRRCTKQDERSKVLAAFEEMIFGVYGFALMFLLIPFIVFDGDKEAAKE